MFTTAGTSWAQLDVDWQSALRELEDSPFPQLFLTISERAYHLICNPATDLQIVRPDGAQEPAGTERELVRQAITSTLGVDWPPYMQQIINAGRSRRAG